MNLAKGEMPRAAHRPRGSGSLPGPEWTAWEAELALPVRMREEVGGETVRGLERGGYSGEFLLIFTKVQPV